MNIPMKKLLFMLIAVSLLTWCSHIEDMSNEEIIEAKEFCEENNATAVFLYNWRTLRPRDIFCE